MKKLLVRSICIILFSSAFFLACKKEGEHHVRISNQFPDTLVQAKIGNATYGVVQPNTVTEYRQLVNGNNPLTGIYSITDSILKGTVSVNGNDIHKYTLKIDASFKRTLVEDK